MRLAFMGSPDYAVPSLRALFAAGHDVVCVYSQPAKARGRGQELRPTPVAAAAAALGLEVRTPRGFKRDEPRAAFAALDLDVAIVVAYGLILPQAVLDAPKFGCLNAHASILPRWRGAAPIQRAIMAGDTMTGVDIMQMTLGLDEGPVGLSLRTDVTADDTGGTLHDRLALMSADLLVEAVAQLARGAFAPVAQAASGACYAHKLGPTDQVIDFSRPAAAVDAQIRGLSPFPGAFFMLPTPKGPVRIKALMSMVASQQGYGAEIVPGTISAGLSVMCGDGQQVMITRLQREGRQAMAADDFLRGQPIAAGTILLPYVPTGTS